MTQEQAATSAAPEPAVLIPRDPEKRAALAQMAGLTDEEKAALDQWCFDQEQERQQGVLLCEAERTSAATPPSEAPRRCAELVKCQVRGSTDLWMPCLLPAGHDGGCDPWVNYTTAPPLLLCEAERTHGC